MDLMLTNKIVAITGPAKGMGEAVTRAFADEGARLALLARDTQAVSVLEKELRDQGIDVVLVACDITKPEQCEKAVEHIREAFGDVPDVLVNVAGGSGPVGKTGADTTFEEFEEIVRLNMTGCFNTMRAVLPGMMARRSGKIVNVGGTFGMRGKAGRMAYSASKWGLRGITKSMALEAGPHNINVNIVAQVWSMVSAFVPRCARTWPPNWVSARRKPPNVMLRIMHCSVFPPPRTLPMRACSWPANVHARLPEPTCQSMAVGPPFKETIYDSSRSRYHQWQRCQP
jgi:NAD(P)-dependent dehydrogenase (short-subunit alcohol dehydrogenase family)